MNKITIIGRLGKDPQSRTTPTGTIVTNFSLVVGGKWKDANGMVQNGALDGPHRNQRTTNRIIASTVVFLQKSDESRDLPSAAPTGDDDLPF